MNTTKILVIVEATRVLELLNSIPDKDLNANCFGDYQKGKAELKNKMCELRRDTIALEKMITYSSYRRSI